MLCCYMLLRRSVRVSSPTILNFASPSLIDRDKVRVPVVKLAQLLDELVDPVLACQRTCVFLDHRDFDRFLMFVVASLRCVDRNWLCLRCEADGYSMYCSECSSF